MNIKERIIKKLERDIEPSIGHINLEELSEEEKNQVNNRAIQLSNQQQNQSITDKDIEDR